MTGIPFIALAECWPSYLGGGGGGGGKGKQGLALVGLGFAYLSPLRRTPYLTKIPGPTGAA
jgi:hypothetical protein